MVVGGGVLVSLRTATDNGDNNPTGGGGGAGGGKIAVEFLASGTPFDSFSGFKSSFGPSKLTFLCPSSAT